MCSVTTSNIESKDSFIQPLPAPENSIQFDSLLASNDVAIEFD